MFIFEDAVGLFLIRFFSQLLPLQVGSNREAAISCTNKAFIF
jgi:hypothetical protein